MTHDLFTIGIPLGEKLIRTFLVYSFLLVGLRLAGKREMGQLNPFDFVVLLLLSNTVQNAIIGNDNSLLGGLVGATALLIINWFVVRFLYTHPAFARLVEGDPDLLIRNGKIIPSRMKKELITPAELEAAARRQGIDGLHKVDTCRLEVGGALTFVPKEPTDDEKRHGEIVRHLESLKESHADLVDRVSRIERL
ncbi:MAG: DUF421 domain-containing protein [Gemmatimonadaceae bacterium]